MSKPSMPFEPETKTPTPDPIAEGVLRLRAEHRAKAEAHRIAFDADAEIKWARAEKARKDKWIAAHKEGNYEPLQYPYTEYTLHEQYRVSLPQETRVADLAKVGLFDQILYCCLARNNFVATVSAVQEFFQPYLPSVSGDATIVETLTNNRKVTHAVGLSAELARILANAYLIETRHGKVSWLVSPLSVELEEY
jgi:hypothetical protein